MACLRLFTSTVNSRYLDIWTRKTLFQPLPRSARKPGSKCFRLLVKAGQRGLPAGEIAQRSRHGARNTMSAHLKILSASGLISAERDGRTIRYVADMTGPSGPAGLPDGGLLRRLTGTLPAPSSRPSPATN